MKPLLFLPFILLFTIETYSQTFKINAGVSASKLDWKVGSTKAFPDWMFSFTGGVGVTYLERKAFDITSSINYLQKGGKDKIVFTDASGSFLREETIKGFMNYINLSNEIRLKYPTQSKIKPYLNIGFYVGYLISTSKNINKDDMADINAGGILGIGVLNRIKKKEIAIQVNWLPSFNQLSDYGTKDNTLSVLFIIGIF